MIPIKHYVQILTQLTGWRRRLALFTLGASATLSLPPFFLFPMVIPAYAGLYLLIHNASPRRAAYDGWWWGWGYFITGLYWFCIALLTEPEKFGWMVPFALLGLNAFFAIYSAIGAGITAAIKPRGITGIILFTTIWTATEWLRGHLFTGFPWNLAGYAFTFSDAALQSASVVGVWGLTIYTVMFGASFATFFLRDIPFARAHNFVLALAAVLVAAFMWGNMRLDMADKLPQEERYVPGVKLRLVQGAIAQPHKWDPKKQIQGMREYIQLTNSPGIENITHVIWPETAVPYITSAGTELTRLLGASIPEGVHLITGTLRAEGAGKTWKVWNSMLVLTHKGDIVGGYDKSKLVPFGEFLPFRSIIPEKWATPVGSTDFSSGLGGQTLHWPGLPGVSPLICYEVIFPERAASQEYRPDWLVSITNDAWFGKSTGPYQHFHMARTRAVEQGLPLVRVANTGITASVDEFGRVEAMMDLGEKGILDIQLQKSQLHATTYSEHKNILLLLWIFAVSLLTLSQYKRKK